MQRNELVDLLENYDPANPERDFDSLQSQFSSSMLCFSVLASSLSTCLPALQLLLGLDFIKVVQDCCLHHSTDLSELERWIGFIPERHLTVNKQEWFKRFAFASVENKCSRLIRKLLRLGQCKLLADTSSEQWDAELFLQVINTEPHAHLKDSLLLAFLSSSFSHSLLQSLLAPVANKWEWIKNIVLNRACLQPNMLFSLLNAAGREGMPVDFVEQICLVWSDNDFVLRAPLTRHAQVSGVIRYAFIHLAAVGSEDATTKDKITNVVLRGVQAHLSCNILEKRILGMIVAEEFTNTFLGDAKRLEFGDDRALFVDEYCPSTVQTPIAKPVEPAAVVVDHHVVDENSLLSWPWPACPFSFHSNENDDSEAAAEEEDDDDVCSLEPFDISEDVEGLIAVPKHLRQIPDMLCSDSIDSVKCALEQFPLIVLANAKRADTRRRAAKFIFTLLELDNKYDLVQFDALRSKAIITLMVCVPQETGPALAKAVYSRSITLGTKMVALECFAEAVKTLADGGFKDEEEEKIKPPPQRPVIQVGTITKRSNKLGTVGKQSRENKLAPLAWQYFFAPMCSRLVQFEREPMLLCKMIACLALVLERSKYAGGQARRMAEEFCQVLPWLKFRTEGEVQRALLYALAAVASVALELVAQDWLKWVYFVANESQDDVAREMAARIGPMLANGVWM